MFGYFLNAPRMFRFFVPTILFVIFLDYILKSIKPSSLLLYQIFESLKLSTKVFQKQPTSITASLKSTRSILTAITIGRISIKLNG